jgi:uncharacterized protein YbaP (TraB family)
MRSAAIPPLASRHSTNGAHFFLELLLALVCALGLGFSPAHAAAPAAGGPGVKPAPAGVEPAAQSKFSRGLLWKIDAPGIKSSYLFGTIHSDDARVTALHESVTQALDASGHVVMEARIDGDAIAYMAEAMYFNDGRTLEQVVGKKLYADSVKALTARGIPALGIEKQKPWAVMMTLSMPTPTTGEYVDLILENRAARLDKSITGLESIEEQIAVFDGLALPDQIALLEEVVQTQGQFKKELEDMIKAYLARDLASLAELTDRHTPGDARIHQTVTDRLLTKRNTRMAGRITPILKQGGAFIAVGAAHLPGKTGLLNLIEQAGYRVTSVY